MLNFKQSDLVCGYCYTICITKKGESDLQEEQKKFELALTSLEHPDYNQTEVTYIILVTNNEKSLGATNRF